jgi:hypothetical protein
MMNMHIAIYVCIFVSSDALDTKGYVQYNYDAGTSLLWYEFTLVQGKWNSLIWHIMKHCRRHRDFDSTFNNGWHKFTYINHVSTKRNSQFAIVCMVSSRNNTDITFLLSYRKKRKEKKKIRLGFVDTWLMYVNLCQPLLKVLSKSLCLLQCFIMCHIKEFHLPCKSALFIWFNVWDMQHHQHLCWGHLKY